MTIDFAKGDGLIPAIIQNAGTTDVLMLGYMNEEALKKTRETGRVTFYSRTRGRLWTKGETSGNHLHVKSIELDCDGDTLLVRAVPNGPVCHTGRDTCFGDAKHKNFLQRLEAVIRSRREQSSEEQSYTASLFAAGPNAVAQKVGEEATELVIEAVAGTDERVLNESADLLFHTMVMLVQRDLSLDQVVEVLERRHQ